MDTLQAVIDRFYELFEQQGTNAHALSTKAGMPPATLKSILHKESSNPGIVTLKKLCDGFDNPPVSIVDFFDTEVFRNLEQEIR